MRAESWELRFGTVPGRAEPVRGRAARLNRERGLLPFRDACAVSGSHGRHPGAARERRDLHRRLASRRGGAAAPIRLILVHDHAVRRVGLANDSNFDSGLRVVPE